MSHLPSDVVAALTDPQLLTLTLYGEARGEPIEGQIAVGCVIRNRVEVGKWGASYAKVCLAPWQFSCWTPQGGKANYEATIRAAEQLARSVTLPDDPLLKQCAWVAQGIIGYWIQDTVKEATHYVTGAMFEARPPRWAVNQIPVAQIAGHVFFRGIA